MLLHVLHRYSHNSHLNNWMGNFNICVARRKQWKPVCRLAMPRMQNWEWGIVSCLKPSEEGIYMCIFTVTIQLYNVKDHVVVYKPITWCCLLSPAGPSNTPTILGVLKRLAFSSVPIYTKRAHGSVISGVGHDSDHDDVEDHFHLTTPSSLDKV